MSESKKLIFGLGGTGERVCVKISEIIESQKWKPGEFPDFVIIDSHKENFDSSTKAISKNLDRDDPDTDKKYVRPTSGDIRLTFDNVRQILDNPAREDNFPVLASCGLSIAGKRNGKGRIEHLRRILGANDVARREPTLGRLAFMARWSQISETIGRRIDAAVRDSKDGKLECYFFSSSFGGTGSGVFIPLMYLIRKIRPGTNVTINLWLFDPSFGDCIHENVTPDEIKRFYRNGFRILRELRYIQNGVTNIAGEGILPYRDSITDMDEIPDPNLAGDKRSRAGNPLFTYGYPESKFDRVLIFSRYYGRGLNNIAYDGAIERIADAFVQEVEMPNSIAENDSCFEDDESSEYYSAYDGVRNYESASSGKLRFPREDWIEALLKIEEYNIRNRAIHASESEIKDAVASIVQFPAGSFDSLRQSLLSSINDFEKRLSTSIELYDVPDVDQEFASAFHKTLKEQVEKFRKEVESWFVQTAKLVKSVGDQNLQLKIEILSEVFKQIDTFIRKLKEKPNREYVIDEEVKRAAQKKRWFASTKTRHMRSYLSEVHRHYEVEVDRQSKVSCVALFNEAFNQRIDSLQTQYRTACVLKDNVAGELKTLLVGFGELEKKILQEPLVLPKEWDGAVKEIIALKTLAYIPPKTSNPVSIPLDKPACIVTVPERLAAFRSALRQHCDQKYAKSAFDLLTDHLMPDKDKKYDESAVERLKGFVNSCAPLFSYVQGEAYDGRFDPELSSYIFGNFDDKNIKIDDGTRDGISNVFGNVQLVTSKKLSSNEIVYVTHLKGLRPDFSRCYQDFRNACDGHPNELQGSLEGRIDRFEQVEKDWLRDKDKKRGFVFGPQTVGSKEASS